MQLPRCLSVPSLLRKSKAAAKTRSLFASKKYLGHIFQSSQVAGRIFAFSFIIIIRFVVRTSSLTLCSLHGHVQSKTTQFIGRMKITSYRMTSSYFSVFSLSNVYPFLASLQLVYSLQDVIVDIGKKILPLWFCERSGLILSGCLVSASSHISSVQFAPPSQMRHCGWG